MKKDDYDEGFFSRQEDEEDGRTDSNRTCIEEMEYSPPSPAPSRWEKPDEELLGESPNYEHMEESEEAGEWVSSAEERERDQRSGDQLD